MTGRSPRSPDPVARNVLSEQVKDRILQWILEGELAPGSRIIETRVARELGVSQAPVREALRDLTTLGVVEIDLLAVFHTPLSAALRFLETPGRQIIPVNLSEIRALKREDDQSFVELSDGQRAPVSRRHLKELKRRLGIPVR